VLERSSTRRPSLTRAGCSMSATATWCAGRHAATRSASRRWWYTAAQARAARRVSAAGSIRCDTGWCFSISGCAGGAARLPVILRGPWGATPPVRWWRTWNGCAATWGSAAGCWRRFAGVHAAARLRAALPAAGCRRSVISGVTTTRRSDIDWLCRGLCRVLPRASADDRHRGRMGGLGWHGHAEHGDYILPGGLAPLHLDRDTDEGHYIEPTSGSSIGNSTTQNALRAGRVSRGGRPDPLVRAVARPQRRWRWTGWFYAVMGASQSMW
jgi:hypothetical protein